VKRGRVGNAQGGGDNHGGMGGGKGSHTATIKSIQHTTAALSTKFDIFIIPDDDSDDSSEEEKKVCLTEQIKL
jgi:hypothetical protein